jgi:hypothetical protein
MSLNLLAAIIIGPIAWGLWRAFNWHAPGSLYAKILAGGFIVTALSALLQALISAVAASRPSFVAHHMKRSAVFLRWFMLAPPLIGLWAVLEAFRVQLVEDFIASSGTAGDTMASEMASGTVFALLWLAWIFVAGKGLTRYLTVDELIARYTGAQITLLRSFKDDEAGVDFSGPVKPDARWQQIRLEPQITHTLKKFGPVVAISGDARTVDRAGARRVTLANDVWQDVVKRWIDASLLTVMLAGKTPSVTWELETIIARDRLRSLLVLLPPLTTDALGQIENADAEERLAIVRVCLERTPWREAARNIAASGVVGLMFYPGGTIATITSPRGDDEDYRIAILVAVYSLFCGAAKGCSAGQTG